jgi:hypothetical protein
MEQSIPSLEEWAALYDAAIEFKKIKSWEWMNDGNMFGVQNPQNGENGYCFVLGKLGEVFALGVCLSSSGLETYLRMQSGKIIEGDPDVGFIQDCLMASYEDRDYLAQEDSKITKQLGLKCRGKNSWPLFRNYEPGYYPWYLNRDEVIYLTQVLVQAKDVCLRFKNNNNLLNPPEKDHYLVRVSEMSENGMTWKDKWLTPPPLPQKEEFKRTIDEVQIRRIKKSSKKTNQVWEVDFFFAPTPIKEEGRPYFPHMILISDHNSGQIVHMNLFGNAEYQKEFQDNFLLFIEEKSSIPARVLIKREEVIDLLEPFSSKLNFNLQLVEDLPCIENAREGMLDYMRATAGEI